MNNQAFSKIWIIVILIVLIVGGILIWRYLEMPKEEVKVPGETEEITNWRTYISPRVGYEFEYPAIRLSLELDETIKSPTQDFVQFATEEVTYGVRTYIDITHKTIEEWIMDSGIAKASSALLDYNKITVASKPAYQYKEGLVVYVLSSENLYIITAHRGIAPSQNFTDPIYNHLLSTLKFTEVTEDETANWKTYRNEEYGFEIKYPQDWIILHEGYYRTSIPYEVSFTRKEFLEDRYIGAAPISITIHTEDLKSASEVGEYVQLKSEEEIVIDDTNSKKQICAGPEGEFERILIPKKEKLIYGLGYSNLEFKDVFYQMLSTFRFLE